MNGKLKIKWLNNVWHMNPSNFLKSAALSWKKWKEALSDPDGGGGECSAVTCESRDMQSVAVLTSSININPHISDIPVSGPQWPAPSCCGPSCCRPPSRPSPRCPARTPGQGPCWLYPFFVNILAVKISYGCFVCTFKKFPNWTLKWESVYFSKVNNRTVQECQLHPSLPDPGDCNFIFVEQILNDLAARGRLREWGMFGPVSTVSRLGALSWLFIALLCVVPPGVIMPYYAIMPMFTAGCLYFVHSHTIWPFTFQYVLLLVNHQKLATKSIYTTIHLKR